MRAVYKFLWLLMFHQTEIGFVYQSRGLQRVVGTFFAKMVVGDSAELVVNQRNQAAQRFFVTGLPLGQQLADRLGRASRHGKPPRRPAVRRLAKISALLTEVNLLKRRMLAAKCPLLGQSFTRCGQFFHAAVSQSCSALHIKS